ncbi:STAS domain-containing protein [Kitasatospora sp. NPDC094015]|uniref:STAS domain-containing protein n=1 Tax=Kitasatospora sp. NPDC094015 TaxID=3155205 RepID=UPI00331AB741
MGSEWHETGAAAYSAPPTSGISAVARQAEGGAVVCRLEGELDLDSLAPARTVLEQAIGSGAPLLVVELAGVTFCDSSGLNLLLQTRLAAEQAGVALRLGPLSAQVARLMEITGAGEVFSVHPSTADALGLI